jgi:DNA-binding MltR family transcriptional regulator
MSTEREKTSVSIEEYEKVQTVLNALMDQLASQLPNESANRIKEIYAFRTSILGETDRGAVLMAAAFLDDKLKGLIEKRLVQDRKVRKRVFDFNGALGTFSSRIDFAYLIGVIPKNAQKDLHTIRNIRNQFAHHAAPLSYDDEKVKGLCNNLVFHGVLETADAGSKFRRSVMGLLTHVTLAFESTEAIEAHPDFSIPDRAGAYQIVSKVFTDVTGAEYPLKHEHESVGAR